MNAGFRSMLQRYSTTNGIRFVVDEAHYILDQENFCKSWAYLRNLKELFPSSPILLLTATCRQIDLQEITSRLEINYQQASLIRNISFEDNQIVYEVQKKKENKAQFLNEIINIYNEIETGKCIIYCPSVKGCENLIIELQTKISKEIIAMYHGELFAKQKSAVLFDWKSEKIRIMIATNAFGMGVNVPDVCIVIHTGFPMSIIQESGRADCDGLPAKAFIMYSRKDIRTIMGIYSNGQPSIDANEEGGEKESIERTKYLSEAKHKIREVLFYCSSIYQCRKKAIVDYFAWPENLASRECNICDNCLCRASDNPVWVDIRADVKKMLEIIKAITSERQQIIRNNVIDVFHQFQAKEIKNKFREMPVYLEKFSRKLKTKEDAFLLLDDLVLRDLVKEDIILTKSPTA
uniref:DNA 3'-5' helicase n=1 Tax=Rhizophagus irregularis (strain DAOM 181602 / DAOM 197198 / MUCL 43194) TaxID=747089 RepID=U9TPM2_RHIID